MFVQIKSFSLYVMFVFTCECVGVCLCVCVCVTPGQKILKRKAKLSLTAKICLKNGHNPFIHNFTDDLLFLDAGAFQ